jgi:hypothetical protein
MTHVEIIERYGFQIALNFFSELRALCEGSWCDDSTPREWTMMLHDDGRE